jgi:hypothetical protein
MRVFSMTEAFSLKIFLRAFYAKISGAKPITGYPAAAEV